MKHRIILLANRAYHFIRFSNMNIFALKNNMHLYNIEHINQKQHEINETQKGFANNSCTPLYLLVEDVHLLFKCKLFGAHLYLSTTQVIVPLC